MLFLFMLYNVRSALTLYNNWQPNAIMRNSSFCYTTNKTHQFLIGSRFETLFFRLVVKASPDSDSFHTHKVRHGLFVVFIALTRFSLAISQYDPRFGDAFWNSSKYNMVSYLLRMMTSWAIVVNVWYLPPMTIQVQISPCLITHVHV